MQLQELKLKSPNMISVILGAIILFTLINFTIKGVIRLFEYLK